MANRPKRIHIARGGLTHDRGRFAVEMKHCILMLVQEDVLCSVHPDQPIVVKPWVILSVLRNVQTMQECVQVGRDDKSPAYIAKHTQSLCLGIDVDDVLEERGLCPS